MGEDQVKYQYWSCEDCIGRGISPNALCNNCVDGSMFKPYRGQENTSEKILEAVGDYFEGQDLAEQKKEPGKKFDQGKLRYDLLPGDVLEEITHIFTLGAEKYGDHNWSEGMSWGRVFGAAMRHMWAFWRGKTIDAESGRPHLAHAIVNLMFLLAYFLREVGTDDRRA